MDNVLHRIFSLTCGKPDDSRTDRWNYSVTAKILIFLILVISTKQYVRSPINCMLTSEFRFTGGETWDIYVNRYCFVENTYFVNESDRRFPSVEQRENAKIRYYQWIPIFLSIQLILFLLVRCFWSAASESTGMDVRSILVHVPIKDVKKFKRAMVFFGSSITNVLYFESNAPRRFLNLVPYTSYLTASYLCYKLISCINVLGQLLLMNYYLNTEYKLWGYDILRDLLAGSDWKSSGQFPRITFCDFFRRDETSSAPISFPVQCVMTMNVFNEKIYILLWFWFVTLATANIISTLYWFFTSLSPYYRRRWITDMLKYNGTKFDEFEVNRFIKTRIPLDGLLCLRLIAANAAEYVAAGIVGSMYEKSIENIPKFENNNNDFSTVHENIISADNQNPSTYPCQISSSVDNMSLADESFDTDTATFDPLQSQTPSISSTFTNELSSTASDETTETSNSPHVHISTDDDISKQKENLQFEVEAAKIQRDKDEKDAKIAKLKEKKAEAELKIALLNLEIAEAQANEMP